MKCSKIEHLLNMYIDKELPAEKVAALKQHLAGCAKCTHELGELAQLKELVHSTPGYSANPFLWTRISTALSKEPSIPVWVLVPRVLRIWIPVACTLILISSIILAQLSKLEGTMYEESPSLQKAILEIPLLPENMERITLNLLVYNGKKAEVNYALF